MSLDHEMFRRFDYPVLKLLVLQIDTKAQVLQVFILPNSFYVDSDLVLSSRMLSDYQFISNFIRSNLIFYSVLYLNVTFNRHYFRQSFEY